MAVLQRMFRWFRSLGRLGHEMACLGIFDLIPNDLQQLCEVLAVGLDYLARDFCGPANRHCIENETRQPLLWHSKGYIRLVV